MKILKAIFFGLRALITFLSSIPTAFVKNIRIRIGILTLIFLWVASFLNSYLYSTLFVEIPEAGKHDQIIWLKQGWPQDEAQRYHQTSQGSLVVPYNWYLAMPERPTSFPSFLWETIFGPGDEQLFNNPTNLSRYRLLSELNSKYNPDKLPIGFVLDSVRPPVNASAEEAKTFIDSLALGIPKWYSLSCAGCHTGELSYEKDGETISVRIEGGPSNYDFKNYSEDIVKTLNLMWLPKSLGLPSRKFDKFAERVLKLDNKKYTDEEVDKLVKKIQHFFTLPNISSGFNEAPKPFGKGDLVYLTTESWGRTMALSRGLNGQFYPLDTVYNLEKGRAPVSFPPLWYTNDYDWVQSISGIRQPLGRNQTEAWGVNTVSWLYETQSPKLWANTQRPKDLFWMENFLAVLRHPSWPEDIFGKIDAAKAEKGRELYHEAIYKNARPQEQALLLDSSQYLWVNPLRSDKGYCARCHEATCENLVYDSLSKKFDKKFIQLPIYKLDVLGTDGYDAVEFNAKKVMTTWLNNQFDGVDVAGVGLALTAAMDSIQERAFQQLNIYDEAIRDTMRDFRSNLFRAPLGYPARPLAGYWATAPHLHNHSIPNMYYLLATQEERPNVFFTGNTKFDPDSLGFVWWEVEEGFFRLDTQIPGNSNQGHIFDDRPGEPGVIGPKLSEEERMAIIEYMKILDYTGRNKDCIDESEKCYLLYASDSYYKEKYPDYEKFKAYYCNY